MNNNPSKSHKDLSGVLFIKDLVVPMHIGVTEDERNSPQNIFIDIELKFKELPKGCSSDNISETICYKSICDEIYNHIKKHEFNLIERLSSEIYDLLDEKSLFSKIRLLVKKKPVIEGLNGYVAMEISSVD
jgi:7,8-dihydroneopterin aldolase/epimerase/oxygenase